METEKTNAEIWLKRFYAFLDRNNARERYDKLADRWLLQSFAETDPEGLVNGVFYWPDEEVPFWIDLSRAWRSECVRFKSADIITRES